VRRCAADTYCFSANSAHASHLSAIRLIDTTTNGIMSEMHFRFENEIPAAKLNRN